MPLDPDVCPSCLRRVTAELELESERRGHARTREMLARAIERAAKVEAWGEDRALDATDGAHPAWWRGYDYGVWSAAEAERLGRLRRETLPCPAHTGAAVPASRFDAVSGPVPEEDDDGA